MIAPVGKAAVAEAAVEQPYIFGQAHVEHDATFHASLRSHLVDLFGSLCDTALEDAIDVARQERDRRAAGSN